MKYIKKELSNRYGEAGKRLECLITYREVNTAKSQEKGCRLKHFFCIWDWNLWMTWVRIVLVVGI